VNLLLPVRNLSIKATKRDRLIEEKPRRKALLSIPFAKEAVSKADNQTIFSGEATREGEHLVVFDLFVGMKWVVSAVERENFGTALSTSPGETLSPFYRGAKRTPNRKFLCTSIEKD
jgi:hypothetical protein